MITYRLDGDSADILVNQRQSQGDNSSDDARCV